ncbi:peroxide stress protein YaaA [Massilia yuzhufengensis]|uniref:UPF0246 protein SAMN05216204_1533 n=1 Tax=Massilia yuzhufengensis TaxID=1164594 RepID=A0A1I1WT36_9BURK|nr:peroxide stress protein YaaA [Massilia yuzhufengensis]SFD98192.1 hypothetical protein SAMN05216204_1533 [Massilia yuzhufengensis]
MLIVLSPAKSLDLDSPSTTRKHSLPDFIPQAAELVEVLRGHSPAQVAELMDLSDTLAMLNVSRYAHWDADHAKARQAIMSFNGDVYGGFDARTLAPKEIDYAQRHVRILSGLYGLLRPLDRMHPYRLEMGTRLKNPRGNNLYAFWGDTVTEALNDQIAATRAKALVNLASEEYFKSVKPKLLAAPVINPVFEDWKNGKYKIISFFAKRARGLMARYAAQHAIKDPNKLKGFDVDGYAFDSAASSERDWVFRRRQEA